MVYTTARIFADGHSATSNCLIFRGWSIRKDQESFFSFRFARGKKYASSDRNRSGKCRTHHRIEIGLASVEHGSRQETNVF